MIKTVVKRALGRTGFRLVRNTSVNTLESHLLDVFLALGINCVLDVGANDGDYGDELRRLGYDGHIVSFEPVSSNFQRLLERKKRDPKWTAHQIALGESDGEAEINVLQGHTFSSFLSPSAYGVSRFGRKMNVERKETVKVRRLDHVLREVLADVPNPRVFLKTDTQGFDMAVIRGARDEMSSILGVQMELALKPLYEKLTTEWTETIRELQGMGFEVTGMFPVTRDPTDGVTLLEVDCVLWRPPARQSAPAATP